MSGSMASPLPIDELDPLDPTDHPPLLPKTTIGQLFPDIPREDYYIVVANGMMLRRSYLCFAMPMSLTTLYELQRR